MIVVLISFLLIVTLGIGFADLPFYLAIERQFIKR
jgi:hypothetical protein